MATSSTQDGKRSGDPRQGRDGRTSRPRARRPVRRKRFPRSLVLGLVGATTTLTIGATRGNSGASPTEPVRPMGALKAPPTTKPSMRACACARLSPPAAPTPTAWPMPSDTPPVSEAAAMFPSSVVSVMPTVVVENQVPIAGAATPAVKKAVAPPTATTVVRSQNSTLSPASAPCCSRSAPDLAEPRAMRFIASREALSENGKYSMPTGSRVSAYELLKAALSQPTS